MLTLKHLSSFLLFRRSHSIAYSLGILDCVVLALRQDVAVGLATGGMAIICSCKFCIGGFLLYVACRYFLSRSLEDKNLAL